jgi:segregation and condensation protein B
MPFAGRFDHSDSPAVATEAQLAAESADAPSRIESILESLIFAADKPLSLKQLGDLVGEQDLVQLREVIAGIETRYFLRGMQLHTVAGGFQFRTHPDNANWVQRLLAQKPVRLSRAQLETMAICAYRQPITRPEIDEIRGVDSGGTLKTLLDRALIRILGKKEEPGRPMLYGTTREFLEFFNLGDLKDLPTLREFHELTEEHQAQVAALESVAPEGTIDGPNEADEAAQADRRGQTRPTRPGRAGALVRWRCAFSAISRRRGWPRVARPRSSSSRARSK